MARVTFTLFFILLLSSCIGEDVLDDRVDERLLFINPIESLSPSGSHQLTVRFFNNVGAEELIEVDYSSSEESVAIISESGLITALSEGRTTIQVSAISPEGVEVSDSFSLEINSDNNGPVATEGFGLIETTSSYILTGAFVIRELPETGSLRIEIDDSYRADTDLPGLYVYLTNNPSSIANAYEIGPVEIFSGSHQYTIPDTRLNDYSHLLYWCKPFEVKVGDGTIETE